MSLEEYKSRMPNLEEQKKQTAAMETMAAMGTMQVQGQADQKKFSKMAESLDELAKVMGGTNGTYDDMILAGLDGTKEKYERLQRIWFKANGAEKPHRQNLRL